MSCANLFRLTLDPPLDPKMIVKTFVSTSLMERFERFQLPELQKAFNLPPGKIFKVCMNLSQNVVKLSFLMKLYH